VRWRRKADVAAPAQGGEGAAASPLDHLLAVRVIRRFPRMRDLTGAAARRGGRHRAGYLCGDCGDLVDTRGVKDIGPLEFVCCWHCWEDPTRAMARRQGLLDERSSR
jgi:hypothetical protein